MAVFEILLTSKEKINYESSLEHKDIKFLLHGPDGNWLLDKKSGYYINPIHIIAIRPKKSK